MRKNWDQYFIDIAKQVATRSTCPRLSVGAVIVKDKNILVTGYNGSLHNAPHCEDVGCKLVDNHCVATVHAEANAIIQAARNGISVQYAVAYVTHAPCLGCYKILCQAGIKRIIYAEDYGTPDYAVFGLNDNSAPGVSKISMLATQSSIKTDGSENTASIESSDGSNPE